MNLYCWWKKNSAVENDAGDIPFQFIFTNLASFLLKIQYFFLDLIPMCLTFHMYGDKLNLWIALGP